MRIKIVLIVLLILSNLGWYVAYRHMDNAWKQQVRTLVPKEWWEDAVKNQERWLDMARRLNNEISMMCVCKK
jgi:hypothetical protein